MTVAYVSAAATRGIIIGVMVALIGAFFTPISVERPLYLVAFMLVITLLFASIGVVGGLWAGDWDHLTVMNQFIVRPLVFFGGVFYSLDILPPLWADLSLLNPMVYMVNGVRFGILGYSDVDPDAALAVLTALTACFLLVDVWLLKRGYGIAE